MTVALLAPNRAMMISPRKAALWSPLRVAPTTGGSGTFAGPYPSAISNLSGWWDAGVIGSALAPSGVPIAAIGSAVGSLADKSGVGLPLTVYHAATTGTASPVLTPRLNGLLGGLGLNTITSPSAMAGAWQQLPCLDPDQGLALSLANLGSAAAWTLYLVWSRPNWRQAKATAAPLVSIAGVTVLAVDSASGSGRLVLFPGVSQTVLTTGMTRRHSHAIIIRNTPGTGISAWLDGSPIGGIASNPLSASYSGTLLFLHDGTATGGAECWFHEAALWGGVALSSANIATLIACQARWSLGTRRGIRLLVTGQSNAGNGLNAGAWHILAQGIAWHLGALAYGLVASYGSVPSTTILGSNAIYPTTAVDAAGVLPGEFLAVGSGDPSTWSLDVGGTATATYIGAQAAADVADVAAIFWPWSESDSTRLYSERATYEAAARRFLALERAMLPGATAANMPHLWWSAIPFPWGSVNDTGVQMCREVEADMAADSTQNVTIIMPQTSDSLPNGVTSFNATAGVWVGGDNSHRDPADLITYAQRAAPVAARAILAATGGDSLSAIPLGITITGGPVISHVYQQSPTVLIVTIVHDGGTDLIVPPTQAASGRGWAVMDGGSMSSPGTLIYATACVRVDATHLQVTLPSAPAHAASACRLFYPYGSHQPAGVTSGPGIGRGNAVTDNYATATKPPGWNIGGDLGSSWAINQPIKAPMTITAGVASGGIVLSTTAT